MADTNETIPSTSNIPALKTTGIGPTQAMSAIKWANQENNGVVIFGDSITYMNKYNPSATNERWSNRGYFGVANFKMGWPFKMLNNAGISGNNTTQMLARIDSDVLAYNPSLCVVFGGVNDSIQSVSVDVAYDTLVEIYETLRSNGISIVTCTVPIVDGCSSEDVVHELNYKISEYCRINDIPLADFASVYADVNNNVAPYQKAGITVDGVHPSAYGGELLADELIRVIEPLTKRKTSFVTRNDFSRNLFTNTLNTGASGNIDNGVAPDGWGWYNTGANPDATFTGSIVDKGSYNEYVVTMENTGTGTESVNVSRYIGSPTPGDVYVITLEFGIEDGVDVNVTGASVSIKGGGSELLALGVFVRDTSDIAPTYNVKGVFVSDEITIPDGADSASISMPIVGSSFVARFGRMQMIKVN